MSASTQPQPSPTVTLSNDWLAERSSWLDLDNFLLDVAEAVAAISRLLDTAAEELPFEVQRILTIEAWNNTQKAMHALGQIRYTHASLRRDIGGLIAGRESEARQ